MAGFLFHDLIFGPVRSRRLGLSLGINLLPLHTKQCTFNCIYCECGWTPPAPDQLAELPDREQVRSSLEKRLKELVSEHYLPDVITYAGNGEPTVHPSFAAIVDDTLALRDRYIPSAKVSVLTNASMLHDPEVVAALARIDNNILKLDAGTEHTFRLINNPAPSFSFSRLIEQLGAFNGTQVIQTMFLRGRYRGEEVDNTTPQEVEAWIGHLASIRPARVMIYPIARETPLQNLQKIGEAELRSIAARAEAAGLRVTVYG